MKEQDIIDLGFTKEFGEDESFYYYILRIGEDYNPLCLISNANDDNMNIDEWYVNILNYDSIKFKTRDSLRNFIELLNNLWYENFYI